jgi:nucleotide-binding universal stress UspA family protein
VYRILLPVDDEDRALSQAAFVASLPAAADEVAAVVTHTVTGEEADAPDELRRVDRVESVRVAREYLRERGIDVELAETRRPPAEGILDIVDASDVDHVAMASRKRSPAGKAVFGSVTQRVLLEATVPVTVVAEAPP